MLQDNKIDILIVDDSVTIRRTIAKHLGDAYNILEAGDGEQAWDLIESNENITLVFADMHMPVMNGMLLLKKIRESGNERISSLPVIIITGYEDSEAAKRASHSIGATDFISKPFDAIDIISRTSSYAKLKDRINSLEKTSAHDGLTGLYSKAALLENGNKALSFSRRHDMESSIIMMAVVGFENIVKTHGNNIAEQVVTTIAARLQNSLRKEEYIGRIGDAIFAVIMPMTKEFRANMIALRLQKLVTGLTFDTGHDKLQVGLAVGLTSNAKPNEQTGFEDLVEQAEAALKLSLEQKNNLVSRYDETYEMLTQEWKSSPREKQHEDSAVSAATVPDPEEIHACMNSILQGEFSAIPDSYLDTLSDIMQKFLAYTNETRQKRTATNSQQH